MSGTVACLRAAAASLGHVDESDRSFTQLKADIECATLCGNACIRVMENMTSLARLEAGLLGTTRQPVHLADVFKTVCAIVRPQIEGEVTLLAKLEPSLFTYDTDSSMLIQMLTNLAQNAVKHTSSGFIELSAHVAAAAAPNAHTIELVVRDTGLGISADRMQSIFSK